MDEHILGLEGESGVAGLAGHPQGRTAYVSEAAAHLMAAGGKRFRPMLVVLALLAHRLRVLELGRPLAVGLGVPDGATRAFVFVGVVLGIAVATSVCGPVAFVALLAGPIARRLMGRTSIVAAALVGASITIAGDYVGAYLIPGGGKLPVGVITGLAGAPVLAWLLVASQRGRSKGTP